MEIYNGYKRLNENYTIISYKELWDNLKGSKEYKGNMDRNFIDFINAIKKHKYSSIPHMKYEEMKEIFLQRITQLSNK